MARAAEDGSDFVIATSDNPRTEEPVKILDDVKKRFCEGRLAPGYRGQGGSHKKKPSIWLKKMI